MLTERQLLLNEKGESGAIVAVLGKEVPVSSTKSFTGHFAGGCRCSRSYRHNQAMRHNFVPMNSLEQSEVSDYIEANVVYGQGLEKENSIRHFKYFWFWWPQCSSLLSNVGRNK